MHLLQSGVPFNVIALWLGHESTNTTHRYVEANLEMKEKALARLEAPDIKLKRFRASDDLHEVPAEPVTMQSAPRPSAAADPADGRAGRGGTTHS